MHAIHCSDYLLLQFQDAREKLAYITGSVIAAINPRCQCSFVATGLGGRKFWNHTVAGGVGGQLSLTHYFGNVFNIVQPIEFLIVLPWSLLFVSVDTYTCHIYMPHATAASEIIPMSTRHLCV